LAALTVELDNKQETPGDSRLAQLLPALQRLDVLLDAAVKTMQPAAGAEIPTSFQGLFITREQVGRLLSQDPGQTPFRLTHPALAEAPSSPDTSPLTWLVQSFALDSFDADILLLALAPEIDLRYEKIYSYLQDDVTRKRPTIDLALNLLCDSAEDKLNQRSHFSSNSPLIKHRLLHVFHDSSQGDPSSLAYCMRLDDQIRRLVLGQSGLDERLAAFCQLIKPSTNWNDLSLSAEVGRALPRLVQDAATAHKPLRLYFQGRSAPEKRQTAAALATLAHGDLLTVRVDRIPENMNPDLVWSLVTREAQLHQAVLFIGDVDDFRGQDAAVRRQDMLDGIASHAGITILAGKQSAEPRSIAPFSTIPIDFDVPDFKERYDRWQSELSGITSPIDHEDLETLAGRFRLTPLQITQAAASAQSTAEWVKASDPQKTSSSPSLDQLMAAARRQCGHELASLAPKISTRYEWDDLILSPDPKAQLREICSQAEFRTTVYDNWGFDRKLSLGKGLNVLFTGPPGTGKTMAAEVIAHELGLDLYRIDLSQVVSKYIGETEKNLDRIFSAAEDSNAILFFDEADALFGKRSEVRDSRDRYANIEISYLLQKMEEYQGISVLATNLRQNIDEAFVRRLHAIVEFPFPDEEYRRRIWQGVFPKETPVADDVKFDLLAHEVRLAGGNIKNMALAASFYAAADGGIVRLSHLIHAAYREHQKLARSWAPGELLRAAAEASVNKTENVMAHS